jgi:hypothetical protein
MFNGKPAELRVPASGQEFKRDFLYIKDLVGAYMAMWRGLARPEVCGEAFNFAVGGQWSPREIIEKLQRLTGLDIPPNITVSDHMEIKSQQVSAEKARHLLGWKPRYSLDAGLSETAKWYTDYLVGPRLSAIEELEPALAPGVNGKLPKIRTQIHIPARQPRNRLVQKARSLLSQPVRRGDKAISVPNVADIRVGRFTRFLGHANG